MVMVPALTVVTACAAGLQLRSDAINTAIKTGSVFIDVEGFETGFRRHGLVGCPSRLKNSLTFKQEKNSTPGRMSETPYLAPL
jgi:hypothetical protein